MGWGVDEKESFPNIIETKTKTKTLNMGVSSYGTAREYLALKNINLDSCKLLVIQFYDNDILENRSFVKNGFSLNISSKEIYQTAQRNNFLKSTYFPFKYSFEFIAKSIRSLTGYNLKWYLKQPQIDFDNLVWVRDLFLILELIQKKYYGKVIFLNLESNYGNEQEFFPKIQDYITQNPINKNLIFLNGSNHLGKDDYFLIDSHINSKGHQKIAKEILHIIDKNQLLE